MKRRMSIRIALAMLLALALILAGCSDNKGNSTAKVYVQGAAASTVARDIAGGGFGAGDVYVNSEPITDQLEPSTQTDNPGAGTNDQLFEATVENVPETITLRVDPLPGFVFNEWKLNTWLLRRSNLGWDAYLDLLLTEAESHSENLTVSADKAQYYIATFERGFYIDLEGSGIGDGTKQSPYSSFTDAINSIPSYHHFDDDEITFKVAGSDETKTLDIASMANIRSRYGDDDGIEEVRVIGGYESTNWNKVGRSRFTLTIDKTFGEAELEELELASVSLPALDYSALRRTDIEMDDFELRDVSVDTVTGSGIIANLVITESAPQGATFINCVVPSYDSNSIYIHSMIKSDTEVTSLENGNNIVIAPGSSDGVVGGNLYLGKDTEVNGYVLREPSAVPDLMNASVLRTWNGDDDLYELLEEDIAGRERIYDDDDDYYWGNRRNVSYGPYEYLDLEKWDNDWKDDIFDDWDDHWDD